MGLVSCQQKSTKAVFGFLIPSALQVLFIPTHFSHRRHRAKIDRECEIFFREGLQQVNLLTFVLKVYFTRTKRHLINFANLQRKVFSVCLRIRFKLAAMKGDGEEEKQEGTANLVDAKETSVDTSVAVIYQI